MLCACGHDPHPGYSELERSGLPFKVLSFDEQGVSIGHTDMVKFHMSLYSGDSLWWSTDEVRVIQSDS
ncbi:MAG: hypothetical protein HKN79_00860, partial [Flavobacteriales bacterium]|nr:hypothetical protein [Flavobacteriales bacterium]